jgi:hypothetical protein
MKQIENFESCLFRGRPRQSNRIRYILALLIPRSITGETGAGETDYYRALQLLLGGRADKRGSVPGAARRA